MEIIQVGRSPVRTSRVVFGTMAIGAARQDIRRRIETIRAAVDAGITTLDTAPLYDFGLCEQTVGQAIAGIRDRVQIFTKVGLRWDDAHGDIMFTTRDEHGAKIAVRKNSRPESLRIEVDRSLQRLRVDVLDMVFVHQLDAHTPVSETMGALRDLLHEGKLRAIGVSMNYSRLHVLEAQRALGDVPLASVQIPYSLLERRHERELLPLAREQGFGVVIHSPLERGLLTGQFTPSTKLVRDDVRRLSANFHPDNITRVVDALRRGVEPVATGRGATIAQVVLAWVLARPEVSAVVVGASWRQQALANAAAAELQLSADERAAIDLVFDDLRLDPDAGLGVVAQLERQGRRLVSGARRWLARAFGKP